jgi:multicomponent Na+:H+ antiporter subunit F
MDMTEDALPVFINWVIAFLIGSCSVGVLRIVIGPTASDQLTALNLVGSQIVALLVLTAVRTGAHVYLDVAMVYALFGFLGVLALTRYLSKRHTSGEPR